MLPLNTFPEFVVRLPIWSTSPFLPTVPPVSPIVIVGTRNQLNDARTVSRFTNLLRVRGLFYP